ncbi:MAG: hypothetical protein E7185_06370 [Erysipelotrichaceae bacterium]|nr:hypothetical protein [Erysipelotrichaceae bacterium]
MDNQIFREKSIKRISSPEELNKYLRVTNPGIWAVLLAVIVLLGGLIVWASVGTLETKVDAEAVVSDGYVQVTVAGDKAGLVQADMPLIIDGNETVLDDVKTDEYGRAVGMAVLNVPDGRYNAEVVIERIAPISFLIRSKGQ